MSTTIPSASRARAEGGVDDEGRAVQALRGPNTSPRKLWAIIMWSRMVTLNTSYARLIADDVAGRQAPRPARHDAGQLVEARLAGQERRTRGRAAGRARAPAGRPPCGARRAGTASRPGWRAGCGPRWKAPPGAAPRCRRASLRSITVPSGASKSSERWAGGRRARVHDQVVSPAASPGSAKPTERRRDVGADGIDVQRDVDRQDRRARQQPTIAPTTASGRPPTALRVPQCVHGGLHRAGEHGPRGPASSGTTIRRRPARRTRSMRVQAEDGAALQLGRPQLDGAHVEVAVFDRRREVPLLERRTHPGVLARRTPPRNTSVSVPGLTPDRSVRTMTSPRPARAARPAGSPPAPARQSRTRARRPARSTRRLRTA